MDREYILAPKVVKVSFKLDAIFAQCQSMYLLNELDTLSGVGTWVTETYQVMPQALRRDHVLLTETGFFIMMGDILPPLPGENLPEHVDRVLERDPHVLMTEIQTLWASKVREFGHEHAELRDVDMQRAFTDRETFVKFATSISERPAEVDLWNEGFDLIRQPEAYMLRFRQHIHTMWDNYLGAEWARQLPLLQESVQAFQRTDLRDLTLYEAIRAVAGRDMRGKLGDYETRIDEIVFSPSPHLGPYIAKMPVGNTLRLLYGARLPRGAQVQSSALSRSDLLIRMNALADDTRLRILEMLTKQEEMRAQDIIEALNLSQSSVSRHLSQLSATGFLIERRRDVNKVYSLNVDRVVDTVRALTNFLSKE